MKVKNEYLKGIIGIILAAFLLFSGCTTDQTSNEETNGESSEGLPERSEIVAFNFPPVDLDNVEYIKPMGGVFDEHVAPVDHIYITSKGYTSNSAEVDVYAPADDIITSIQHMGSFKGDNNYQMDDYHVKINHADGFDSIFIHIDTLASKLNEVAPEDASYVSVNIPVEAGEIIGTYSGSLDYMVVDKLVTLAFVNLESYRSSYGTGYDDRVHISSPFDYFNEEIQEKLIEKCLRTETPIGGFIDYDIDGTLVGTWFEENTNGWNGLSMDRYWAGHLAIIYDFIDPDHIIVSVGTFTEGQTGQFGVRGNSPDPADISVETGLVKYELVGYDHFDGDTKWDMMYYVSGLKVKNYEENMGIALFQLLEDGKLKAEFFPYKTSSEVTGFADNALIYVR